MTLATTTNQQLNLQRLTLAANGRATNRPHSGPALVYVVSGSIEVSDPSSGAHRHGVGEVFIEDANDGTWVYRNLGEASPAKLLVYSATTVNSN